MFDTGGSRTGAGQRDRETLTGAHSSSFRGVGPNAASRHGPSRNRPTSMPLFAWRLSLARRLTFRLPCSHQSPEPVEFCDGRAARVFLFEHSCASFLAQVFALSRFQRSDRSEIGVQQTWPWGQVAFAAEIHSPAPGKVPIGSRTRGEAEPIRMAALGPVPITAPLQGAEQN